MAPQFSQEAMSMAPWSVSMCRARTAGSGLFNGLRLSGCEAQTLAIWMPAAWAASPMRLTSSADDSIGISCPNRISMASKPALLACRNLSAGGRSLGKMIEQMLLVKRDDAAATGRAAFATGSAEARKVLRFMVQHNRSGTGQGHREEVDSTLAGCGKTAISRRIRNLISAE